MDLLSSISNMMFFFGWGTSKFNPHAALKTGVDSAKGKKNQKSMHGGC